MEQNVTIRVALPEDAPRLLEIYAPYVRDTAVTFEYEVPSEAEFRDRITSVLQGYPYLVAERDGRIIGYAYAHAFAVRKAYSWNVEMSIYVDSSCRRSGAGKTLYGMLERVLKEMNVLKAYAIIASTDREDPYLTADSGKFHSHEGYEATGTFRQTGCKFNRWYDTVWMEKSLGEHTADPAPLRPFAEVRGQFFSGN